MRVYRFLPVLILAVVTRGAVAFVSTAFTTRRSVLALLPSQGAQLEAAINAGCVRYPRDAVKEEDQKANSDVVVQGDQRRTRFSSACELVSRMIYHPTLNEADDFITILHPFKHDSALNQEEDDVVLFPINGFRLIYDNKVVRALPTTSNPACRITAPEQRKEVLYGWFSPGCRLAP